MGWRLALYLCSPSLVLGLRVIAYLVSVGFHRNCEHGGKVNWQAAADIEGQLVFKLRHHAGWW